MTRKLGEGGKEFVMRFESKGRRPGYDIRSFEGTTDDELFIEVKTTNPGKYQPFLISANELEFSREQSDKYSLYCFHDFSGNPAVFQLRGLVEDHVDLIPKIFSANF